LAGLKATQMTGKKCLNMKLRKKKDEIERKTNSQPESLHILDLKLNHEGVVLT
jgi:hypothetical protein